MVAAVRRLQDRGFKRIAVLDIDGHHGDGTESLLLEERILTISVHQFGDRTYPGTGSYEQVGREAGEGFAMNVPLVRGTGDAAYRSILTGTVAPLLLAYRPDVLIVEFGTDAHAADPLLRLQLSTGTYAWIAHWIHELAHTVCEGRLLIVGGGGYEPHHVVRCWMLMLAALAGAPPARLHPDVEEWLAEPAPAPNAAAEAASCVAALRARERVFPFHRLSPHL